MIKSPGVYSSSCPPSPCTPLAPQSSTPEQWATCWRGTSSHRPCTCWLPQNQWWPPMLQPERCIWVLKSNPKTKFTCCLTWSWSTMERYCNPGGHPGGSWIFWKYFLCIANLKSFFSYWHVNSLSPHILCWGSKTRLLHLRTIKTWSSLAVVARGWRWRCVSWSSRSCCRCRIPWSRGSISWRLLGHWGLFATERKRCLTCHFHLGASTGRGKPCLAW